MKKSCNVKNTSCETFVRKLIERYICQFNIRNKNCNEDLLDLDKAYISQFMNNKRNIPKKICNILLRDDFDKKTKDIFTSFVKDELDQNLLVDSINELKTEISQAENLNENQKKAISNLEDNIEILSTSFTLALKVDNKIERKNFTEIIWKNGANSIDLVFGDIFKFGFDNRKREKNIIVIPVNTSFATHITAKVEKEKFPLVSEKTIHGMWLSRMYKCNYKEEKINNLIKSYLERYNASLIDNYNNYPIGTISEIYHKNMIFYLLAISKFDENNNAKSYKHDIRNSLKNLLKHYDKFGQGYHLYLPLIGTGLSRANLSNKDSFKLICSEMIKNKKKIHGNITIVALPDVKDELMEILSKEKL